jgi:acylphosphatase
MIRRTVVFSGRVQGVGFRFTTCRIAENYTVTGYVKNLPDGRVEAVVEGETAEIERFLTALRQDMAGHIRDELIREGQPSGEFRSFDVRF